MELIQIDLENIRCPEAFITIRKLILRHLKNHQNVALYIITSEPSSIRDVPIYCNSENYIIERSEIADDRFHFLIVNAK
ncbi:hypothetical protein EIJ81_00685 (plasmid) [Aliivibrio salmonicida]|uniref:sulfurtransferase TusA family protein n=1 Tax=Aliivibrio salmonicida TaxID=40269 RepID=UPI000F6D28EA|nr:hypothetical protein EIJ81_00685 [Aliivibrio salmonicida]